ncbi:hypothetical protein VTH06DRAFT_2413 [Thermothelomyces fergusii]
MEYGVCVGKRVKDSGVVVRSPKDYWESIGEGGGRTPFCVKPFDLSRIVKSARADLECARLCRSIWPIQQGSQRDAGADSGIGWFREGSEGAKSRC